MNPRLPDVNLLVVLVCGVVAFLALLALLVDDVVKIRAEALTACVYCSSSSARHAYGCPVVSGRHDTRPAAVQSEVPVEAFETMECPDCYWSGQTCPEHAEVTA